MHKSLRTLVALGCAVGFVAPAISNAQTAKPDKPTSHMSGAAVSGAGSALSEVANLQDMQVERSINNADNSTPRPSGNFRVDPPVTNIPGAGLHADNPAAQLSTSTAPASQAGPVAGSTRLGVASTVHPSTAPTLAPRPRAGQSVALMVVGGGALLTGLIIGGDAGTLISVTGVVIGLYGLYNYVK